MQDKAGNDEAITKDTAVRVIRDICAFKEIKIEKVLFFGSRSRGDHNNESDWDFLFAG
ncbi:MAG: nucleotidyltransferase domain-containing protein [bacterium]|nr:nucleotidyltransferase domain-containing protein [bacterium]